MNLCSILPIENLWFASGVFVIFVGHWESLVPLPWGHLYGNDWRDCGCSHRRLTWLEFVVDRFPCCCDCYRRIRSLGIALGNCGGHCSPAKRYSLIWSLKWSSPLSESICDQNIQHLSTSFNSQEVHRLEKICGFSNPQLFATRNSASRTKARW